MAALCSCILSLFMAGCLSSTREAGPLPVVPFVDLKRYTGVWHEIARFPHRFQKECVGSRATYTIRPDGKIDVLNECFEGSPGGKRKEARGTAWVVDPQTNAKLKVSFFWPFSGDYWVIDLGKDYEYAVVGHPNRNYLWILSRAGTMEKSVYEGIIARLAVLQYDTSRLIVTSPIVPDQPLSR